MKKAANPEISVVEFLLSTFGYSKDKQGYIIEEKSAKRILASDGKEIRWEDLGVIQENGQLIRFHTISLIAFSDFFKKSAAKA